VEYVFSYPRSFGQNLASLSRLFAADRIFQFQERRQHFIRSHSETLFVAAMRVSNPDCSPFVINR
jgi:hypothetical protein